MRAQGGLVHLDTMAWLVADGQDAVRASRHAFEDIGLPRDVEVLEAFLNEDVRRREVEVDVDGGA